MSDMTQHLDLDDVVRALRCRRLDAHLENTGGNCLAVVIPLDPAGERLVAVTAEGAARYDRTRWEQGQEPLTFAWIEPGTAPAQTYIDLALSLCEP